MSDAWVANASPIIALAKCGYLDLFSKLSGEILVPQPVVDEIVAGPSVDPARRLVEAGWGCRATARFVGPELLEWGLGPGETSVLALAQERTPAIAVLDDAAARTCAKVIGVPVIGSLGIIVRAKKQARAAVRRRSNESVAQTGLYLDNEVIRRALQYVGESWEPE